MVVAFAWKEELWKSTKAIDQDSPCCGQDTKGAPPKKLETGCEGGMDLFSSKHDAMMGSCEHFHEASGC
jgi:hypothetical protein